MARCCADIWRPVPQASRTRLIKHGAFLRRKVAVGWWFRSIHPLKPPPLFGAKCCRVCHCARHAATLDTHSVAKAARALTPKQPPLVGTQCCRVGLRPPRGNAPHTHSFAKAARALTRLASAVAFAQCENFPTCRCPREIRRGDASSPHVLHQYVFHKIYASRQHPSLPLGSLYTRPSAQT